MPEPDTRPALQSAARLINYPVVTVRGEELGRIEEIMIDTGLGQIAYAVLSFGEPFGRGDRLFALPWGLLREDVGHQRFMVDLDEERLKSAPGFDKSNWPAMGNPGWARRLQDHYGCPPYWEDQEGERAPEEPMH